MPRGERTSSGSGGASSDGAVVPAGNSVAGWMFRVFYLYGTLPLAKTWDLVRPVVHMLFVPAIVYVGITNSVPRPALTSVLSPLP